MAPKWQALRRMSAGLPDEGATGSVHFCAVTRRHRGLNSCSRRSRGRCSRDVRRARSLVISQPALHKLDEPRGTDDLSCRGTDLNHEVVLLRAALPNACRKDCVCMHFGGRQDTHEYALPYQVFG